MKKILIPVLAIITIISCKEKETPTPTTPTCVAGMGGSVTLTAQLKHHDEEIHSLANYKDSLMVKFNTTDFPGTNPANYDLIVTGEVGEDHIHVSGLKCGKYYLYATGFDTTETTRVKGGIPFEITATSGMVNVVVPVTE